MPGITSSVLDVFAGKNDYTACRKEVDAGTKKLIGTSLTIRYRKGLKSDIVF